MNSRDYREQSKGKTGKGSAKSKASERDLKQRLGEQIFLARERSGLTQQALARRLGTRQTNISRMERGDSNFTIELLQKIARAVGAKWNVKIG